MNDLITEMESRIIVAKQVDADLRGKNKGGLTVKTIGEFTLVDDGADRWIVGSDDYDEAVNTIIGEILEDSFDPIDETGLDTESYERLCNLAGCIYSRIGTNNDIGKLLEAIQTDESQVQEICEWLGVEDEPQVVVALQLISSGPTFSGGDVSQASSDWIDTELSTDEISKWIAIGVWDPGTAEDFRDAGCTPEEIGEANNSLLAADKDQDNSQYTDGSPIYATCHGDISIAVLISECAKKLD